MDLKMTLDELTPLVVYCDREQLTYKEVLAKALANKVGVYYVFDRYTEVTYVPKEDFENSSVSDGGSSLIEEKYEACDFMTLGPDYIRVLWRAFKNENFNMGFEDLFYWAKPKGYEIASLMRDFDGEVVLDNLFVGPNLEVKVSSQESSVREIIDKPSNTALKVIGLLMCHLAKSPKYSSGSSPNKSQIKELLLDLAEEQQVNAYGLSKVDERLLAEAMKYLESQKL
jgi:hypothetical protein